MNLNRVSSQLSSRATIVFAVLVFLLGSPATPTWGQNAPPAKPTGPKKMRPPAPRRQKGQSPKLAAELKPGEVPAMDVENRVYDFGRARAGTDIKHDFVFRNTGNGPLEIFKIETG